MSRFWWRSVNDSGYREILRICEGPKDEQAGRNR